MLVVWRNVLHLHAQSVRAQKQIAIEVNLFLNELISISVQ